MSDHLTKLLQQKETIFHTQDLAILWNISNKNTLYTTIKRYCQKKALFSLQKGMYSSIEPDKLDPYLLGVKALHNYTYISCETVLSLKGYLNQPINQIILVSDRSLYFKIDQYNYRARKLKDEFLFNPVGIIEINGIKTATVERSIADLLYFNPHTTFDRQPNWDSIKKMQKEMGYPLTNIRYATTKKRRHDT